MSKECFKVFSRLFREGVFRGCLEGCFKGISRVIRGYFKGISRMFSRLICECFKDLLNVFYICFLVCFKGFPRCFTGVSGFFYRVSQKESLMFFAFFLNCLIKNEKIGYISDRYFAKDNIQT